MEYNSLPIAARAFGIDSILSYFFVSSGPQCPLLLIRWHFSPPLSNSPLALSEHPPAFSLRTYLPFLPFFLSSFLPSFLSCAIFFFVMCAGRQACVLSPRTLAISPRMLTLSSYYVRIIRTSAPPTSTSLSCVQFFRIVNHARFSHCQLCEMHLALSVNNSCFVPTAHAYHAGLPSLRACLLFLRITSELFGHRLRRPLPRCLVSSSFTLSITRDFHIVNHARCHLALSLNGFLFCPDRSCFPRRLVLSPRMLALSPRLLTLSSYYVRIIRTSAPPTSTSVSCVQFFHIVNFARFSHCQLCELSSRPLCKRILVLSLPRCPPLSVSRICPNRHTTLHVLCSLD